MPAFSAIGVAIAEAIIGGGFISAGAAAAAGAWGFVAVASVAAIGAAYITSRVINGNPNNGGMGSSNEGGRIQIPPATNNKIPVVYGSAYINGMITDARLVTTDKSKNDVMYYCIVLSEAVNSSNAAYGIDYSSFTGGGRSSEIYWNDQRLIFSTDSGNEHRVIKGVKTVDTTDDTIDSNFDGFLEMKVYAGSGAAANQIWPPTGTQQNAWDYWAHDVNGTPFWDSTYKMEGLVFAIVRLKYNADKGFTNLSPVTFKLSNSLTNPASVWNDYMTSDRYGAGISSNSINYTEVTKWYNYCEELIRYTNKDGTSSTQKRASMNGVIDTSRSVKENIDTILLNGNAWMSFDVAAGTWRPIIQKAINAGDPDDSSTHFTATITGNTTLTVTAFPSGRIEAGQMLYKTDGTYLGTITSQTTPLTSGESTGQKGRYTISSTSNLSSTTFYTKTGGLLTFNDDNIVSGISISSTRLDDLYNAYEVEFFDKHNRDQKAYARDELPDGDRNPTEPDNVMRIALDMTNNSIQSDMIGQIQLRQSRDDLVVEFTSSFYGIQAQAGDIIELTNDLYNWNPKLFRVIRVKEIEQEDGGLVANIQALEYNDDIYTTEVLSEFTTQNNVGIPPIYSGGTDGNIRTPDDNLVAVTDNSDRTASIPYIVLAATVPAEGGPYDEIQVWYAVGPDPEQSGLPTERSYTLLQSHKPPSPATIYENTRVITVTSITNGDTMNTDSDHGMVAGDQIFFNETTSHGLIKNTIYWVVTDGLTSTAFKVAKSENGSIVSLTNDTGLSLGFNRTHAIYITGLPGNQTGQKYYFKIRMGLNNRYGYFTSPDAATLTNPTTNWNPGGESSGFNLSGATEGEVIYYDATTERWKNTGIITINDTGATSVDINGSINVDIAVKLIDNNSTAVARGIGGKMAGSDYWNVGGYSIGGADANDGALEIATANNGTEPIYVRQYTGSGTTSDWPHGNTVARTLTLLDNAGDTNIPGSTDIGGDLLVSGDLAVNGGDITTTATNTTLFSTANAVAIGHSDIATATQSSLALYGSTGHYYTSGSTTVSTPFFVVNQAKTGYTPAAGFGTGISFLAADNSSAVASLGNIEFKFTDVTHGATDAEFRVRLKDNGTIGNQLIVESTGNLKLAGNIASTTGELRIGSYNSTYYDVIIDADLQLTTNKIKSSTGDPLIDLSSNRVNILGDLNVQGTTTTIDSEVVLIKDNIITLNSSVTGSPTTDSGIEIERGTSANSSLLWNETTDKWYQNRAGTSTVIPINTDELAEGSNKYFTNSLARSVLSGGTGVTYNSSSGLISIGQDVSTTSDVVFASVDTTDLRLDDFSHITWGIGRQFAYTVTIASGSGANTIKIDNGATFSSKKFFVTVKGYDSGTGKYKRETSEIMLTHDYGDTSGATMNTYITEYANVRSFSGASLGTFSGYAGGAGNASAGLQFFPNRTNYPSLVMTVNVHELSVS